MICFLRRALGGAPLGLIPFFIARGAGKPNMGVPVLICCALSVLIPVWLPLWGMVGFTAAELVSRWDIRPVIESRPAPPPRYAPPAGPISCEYEYNDRSALGLTCLSGPLKGRIYRVGRDGLMLGRDYDCGVRFAPNTSGISRHHCSIRWCRGGPVLVDLSSGCGSFLSDGRQILPHYPIPLQVGSRFYLGDPQYMFQLVQMN